MKNTNYLGCKRGFLQSYALCVMCTRNNERARKDEKKARAKMKIEKKKRASRALQFFFPHNLGSFLFAMCSPCKVYVVSKGEKRRKIVFSSHLQRNNEYEKKRAKRVSRKRYTLLRISTTSTNVHSRRYCMY